MLPDPSSLVKGLVTLVPQTSDYTRKSRQNEIIIIFLAYVRVSTVSIRKSTLQLLKYLLNLCVSQSTFSDLRRAPSRLSHNYTIDYVINYIIIVIVILDPVPYNRIYLSCTLRFF